MGRIDIDDDRAKRMQVAMKILHFAEKLINVLRLSSVAHFQMVIRIVTVQIEANDRNSSIRCSCVVTFVVFITKVVLSSTHVCCNNALTRFTVSPSYFLWRLLLDKGHEPKAPIVLQVVERSIGPPS